MVATWFAQAPMIFKRLDFGGPPNATRRIAAVTMLTACSAILGIFDLGSKSLWLDEAFTAWLVSLPFLSLVKVVLSREVNMALYYLMMHEWVGVFGTGEFALRLPSTIAAILTIPLVFALGAELCNERVGLVAALLVTINASWIENAQNARSYTMLVLLVTWWSLLFIRGTKAGGPTQILGYVVSGVSAVYTHLFAILVVPCQWISLALFHCDSPTARRYTRGAAAIVALSLPAFVLQIRDDAGQMSWIRPTTIRSIVGVFAMYVGSAAFYGRMNIGIVVLPVLYSVSLVVGFLHAISRRRVDIDYLIVSLVLPVAITIAVSFFKPLFVPRYLLFGLPFFALAVSVGLSAVRSEAIASVLLMSIVGLSVYQDVLYYRAPARQDWRAAADYIADHARAGDLLVICPPFYRVPLEYYAARLSKQRRAVFPEIFQPPISAGSAGPAAQERLFVELLRKDRGGLSARTWFVTTDSEPKTHPCFRELAAQRRVVQDSYLPGVRVILMEKSSG
jgi:mannosyltransferase